jgi:Tol biopolymer transport system component
MRLDGTGVERLTDHAAYDDQAVLSPNGKTITFVSSRATGRTSIWVLDLATRRARALTQSSGSDFRPARRRRS